MRKRTGAAAVLLAISVTAAEAQTWRTVTSSRQLRGEEALAVTVSYGVGRLTVAPGAPGTLYRMELRYDEEAFAPVREFDAAEGTLRLGMRSTRGDKGRGVRVSTGDRGRDEEPSTLEVALTPEIPLDLLIQAGAAEAIVDLSGLAIRSLRYRTGASESRLMFDRPNGAPCDSLRIEAGAASFHASGLANAGCRRVQVMGGVGEVVLDFGGAWRQSMDATVRVTIGELTLRIPRGVGVAMRMNRFLASFEHAGFVKRGDVYYTSNFDSARYRLNLSVNAAIGGINVMRVEN